MQRLHESLVDEQRRIHTLRERTDFLERLVRLGSEPAQKRIGACVPAQDVLGQPDPDSEGDEPLLDAVVEVSLDPPALPIGCELDSSA